LGLGNHAVVENLHPWKQIWKNLFQILHDSSGMALNFLYGVNQYQCVSHTSRSGTVGKKRAVSLILNLPADRMKDDQAVLALESLPAFWDHDPVVLLFRCRGILRDGLRRDRLRVSRTKKRCPEKRDGVNLRVSFFASIEVTSELKGVHKYIN